MKIKPCVASTCLFIIISCTPAPEAFPEYIHLTGIDFSKYTEQGFLFTPDKYAGDYKSVGLIRLTHTPQAKLLDFQEILDIQRKDGINTHIVVPPKAQKKWVISEVGIDSLLQSIHEECVLMGADAFTQMIFRTEKIPMPSSISNQL
ncbi:MAG: hypothetical protein HOE61_10435, partial [Candidatus Marinimicrobia bacterium]|nr:hypothetical protein [Candidatus Neomarinimicrobiota bacterium]